MDEKKFNKLRAEVLYNRQLLMVLYTYIYVKHRGFTPLAWCFIVIAILYLILASWIENKS